ncbi:hypothetical protein L3556_14220 [Candidatus Synechococcus calcipolaris G9]|uniref:DUF1579 domain-containing protein n=1 Tax=Candidatus Synechococcus calcipolaris G9 TaxID=1497997 RepID=A0ABT6F2N1_9SYNE|nr:hypothetical protein [Candidatus Synechococcus calcipolaris]MDG2992077.1 hypothetical protein [Candidatus Synechococcus calcipolaris G9]
MSHTFLVDVGRWLLQGQWRGGDRPPIDVTGKILVTYSQDDWFVMAAKLSYADTEQPDIVLQYRGKLALNDQTYTFILQHSALGRLEGEGWIGEQSIVQRFWLLGDTKRRGGFENLWRLNDNEYFISSGLTTGHKLTDLMEATLKRVST